MNTEDRKRRGSWFQLMRNLGLMLAGGAAMSGAMLMFSTWEIGDRWLTRLSTLLSNPQPSPQVDVRSLVIQQVREASDLTTAVFTMQAVVPTSQDATIGGIAIGTTKLLYVAHGEVQAGVDLSKITPANVQTSGQQVRLQLPPPQLLNSKIDVNRSNVYDYNRGWLGLGPDVAPQLQTQAQQKALQTIVEAACTDGILQRASDRAKFVVTQLLKTAGYQTVTIEVTPPANPTCKPAVSPA